MTAKQSAVKKYVVKLSAEEREQFDALIRVAKHPACPVVCVDDTSKQLVAETRVPIKAKPGRIARYDYEYERNGTANLFMMFAPLEGWRHVKVTDRRIPDQQMLVEEVAAWERTRNRHHVNADWHFTTANARIKLKRLYPAL